MMPSVNDTITTPPALPAMIALHFRPWHFSGGGIKAGVVDDTKEVDGLLVTIDPGLRLLVFVLVGMTVMVPSMLVEAMVVDRPSASAESFVKVS